MQQSLSPQSLMHVREFMTHRVNTIGLDDSIRVAKDLFDREHFHHVVVLERKKVVGVVSDRDILRVISPFVGNVMERPLDRSTLNKRIHQIMSRELITIGPDETVTQAALIMHRDRVSCLPVVDENQSLLGILTIRDFVIWASGDSDVK